MKKDKQENKIRYYELYNIKVIDIEQIISRKPRYVKSSAKQSTDVQKFSHANSVLKVQGNQIWLGDRQAADNIQWLKLRNIRTVFTLGQGLNVKYDASIRHYLYAIKDNKKQNIIQYFDQASEKIDKALRFASVLVHCGAGVSRSTAFVIAYLIRYQKLTFIQSLKMVKQKRHCVCPNLGFELQLKAYSSHWNFQIPRNRNKELLMNLKKTKKQTKNLYHLIRASQVSQDKMSYPAPIKGHLLARSTMDFDTKRIQIKNHQAQKQNIFQSLPEIRQKEVFFEENYLKNRQQRDLQKQQLNINIADLSQKLKKSIKNKQKHYPSSTKKQQCQDIQSKKSGKDLNELKNLKIGINQINYTNPLQRKQDWRSKFQLKDLIAQNLQSNRIFDKMTGKQKHFKINYRQVRKCQNSKGMPEFSAEYLRKIAEFRFGVTNAQKWNISQSPRE